MIGVDDEQRVFPQAILIHAIQHLAQVMVAHGDQRRVFHADMVNGVLSFGYIVVGGPITQFSLVFVGKTFFPFRLGKEGLVWIEGFDLQKPLIVPVMPVKEIKPGGKGHRLGHFLLTVHVFPVCLIPVIDPAYGLPVMDRIQQRLIGFPGVALLPPAEIIGGITAVIGAAPVFPIVIVVGGQMRINAIGF